MIKELNIIGSGLTGPLLATLLAKKHNCNIDMYERSFDSRISNKFSGRSINLALSKRGIHALKMAGVYDKKFESQLIPMYGRAIHDFNGKQSIQLYGNKKEHFINSVSRTAINQILIDAAEKTKRVKINFNMKCNKVKFDTREMFFENKTVKTINPIIGADGYRSVVSHAIAEYNNQELDYIDVEHSYKELTIQPKNNEFQLEPNYLHIWPRRDLMIIALPNTDKSFTCTLFMKSKGKNSFDSIRNVRDLHKFFEENFSDLIPLIDNLDKVFFDNPTGKLVGLKVPTWSIEDKALIIGDAAHATVPFYGQGMNSAFEDCYVLSKLITKNKDSNWESLFSRYQNNRKKDADTILQLSLDNYRVMRNDVLDDNFLMKQKLSFSLNQKFPNQFIPIYTMVSFTNIPYSEAFNRYKIQEEILNKLLINQYDEIKLEELINKNLDEIIYN